MRPSLDRPLWVAFGWKLPTSLLITRFVFMRLKRFCISRSAFVITLTLIWLSGRFSSSFRPWFNSHDFFLYCQYGLFSNNADTPRLLSPLPISPSPLWAGTCQPPQALLGIPFVSICHITFHFSIQSPPPFVENAAKCIIPHHFLGCQIAPPPQQWRGLEPSATLHQNRPL